MTKTIILHKDGNGSTTVVEEIMRGAIASGYVISKSTLLFKSKKEAQDILKNHPCRSGYKVYTLNHDQEIIVKQIKRNKERFFIPLNAFLRIKGE